MKIFNEFIANYINKNSNLSIVWILTEIKKINLEFDSNILNSLFQIFQERKLYEEIEKFYSILEIDYPTLLYSDSSIISFYIKI
jgi:hypothetical protein